MDGTVAMRPYGDADERGWVLCRVLSFLDSAFYDDVRQAKEHYEHDSIELVAEQDDGIRPVRVFAHYLGEEPEAVRARFRRVHEDALYELRLE